jgi:hypothetical protein
MSTHPDDALLARLDALHFAEPGGAMGIQAEDQADDDDSPLGDD